MTLPRTERGRRDILSRVLDASVHLLGLAAFLYPFLLAQPGTDERAARAGDAPLLFAALGALMIALAVVDLRAGRSDVKRIALLGILAGINAALRLPGSLGGASLMFVLPILSGAAFGARFGFLLGSLSFAVSAVITGGIGPWLPFQMWGLGWVGAGGAIAGRLCRMRRVGRPAVLALCAYGWVAGLAFGALLNLWFWPLQQGAATISYAPGIGVGETVERYWRFYALTSLAWDSSRAIANVVLIAALGPTLLPLLARFRARLEVRWEPAADPVPARVA